jgi:hypothetical protein
MLSITGRLFLSESCFRLQARTEASPDAALRTLLVAPSVHRKDEEDDGDGVQETNGEPLAQEQHDDATQNHRQHQLDEWLPLSAGNGHVGSGATTPRNSSTPANDAAAADAQLKQLRQEKAQLSQRLRAVEEAAAEALGELEDMKVSCVTALCTCW